MKAVGIVAEYNPFHRGHLYHMDKSRELAGAEAVVCVLSGDFVQRGTPAVFAKAARAEAAVRCGASLVLELPLPWSVASAEGFARGAVGLLGACGVVDCLSFGSESGDLPLLEELAEALSGGDWTEPLRAALGEGLPFAAAREKAVGALLGQEKASALRTPNNTLGVEYLKAIRAQGLNMRCVTVSRKGSRHDGPGSASDVRAALNRGESVAAAVPAEAMEVYERESEAGRGPVSEAALESALLSRLRQLSREAFAAVPDASEGLENLLYKAAREEPGLEELLAACKSRRYALARLRRMVWCAALGVERGMAEGVPPYIRVLAADEKGRELLREMRGRASAPVLTRAGAVRGLDERCQRIFETGSAAHDLYVLGYGNREARRGGGDWRETLFWKGEAGGAERVAGKCPPADCESDEK